MKLLGFLFCFCMLGVPALRSEPPAIKEITVHVGTLTLTEEGIDFDYGGKKTRYGFSKTEGKRVVWLPGYGTRYVPTKEERETNPAEYGNVTLRGSNGRDTIVLRHEKPVAVVRMEIAYLRSDSHTLWKQVNPEELPGAVPQ